MPSYLLALRRVHSVLAKVNQTPSFQLMTPRADPALIRVATATADKCSATGAAPVLQRLGSN